MVMARKGDPPAVRRGLGPRHLAPRVDDQRIHALTVEIGRIEPEAVEYFGAVSLIRRPRFLSSQEAESEDSRRAKDVS